MDALTRLAMSGQMPFGRKNLKSLPFESIHRPRNLTKADVSRLEWPPQSGQFVVLKDISRRPLWFRWLLGRAFMAREWRALCALRGLDIAPEPLKRVDKDAFIMGCVPGKILAKHSHDEISLRALQGASQMLQTIHNRGVTHGDLHRANLLVDETGRARVVDWATASVFRSRLGWKKWTQREWQLLDLRAIAKLKRHHAPELLSEDEKSLLERQTPLQLWVRRNARRIRALLGLTKSGHKSHSQQ